jgi:nicotinate-nucleotide adenylyltransferase
LDRLLLFGGSFDPLHHGHLIVSRHVAERLDCARVVLIPSAMPPHKQDHVLAPAEDRLAMCRAAVEGDTQFEVSDWETRQSGPNYTLHTVEHFRRELGAGVDLCWLIGMDSLRELGTWHRAAELVDGCTVVTAGRPGYERPGAAELGGHFSAAQIRRLEDHVVDGPRIDISADEIRARWRRGVSVRYLVPEAVWRYMERTRLYDLG